MAVGCIHLSPSSPIHLSQHYRNHHSGVPLELMRKNRNFQGMIHLTLFIWLLLDEVKSTTHHVNPTLGIAMGQS